MPKQTSVPERFDSGWIQALDGRTSIAQTMRERYSALSSDLGGHDHLSYQRKSLASRALWIEAQIEMKEAALARGEEVDTGALTQQINSLLGLYKTLGLDRVAKDAPDLATYLAAKGAKQ